MSLADNTSVIAAEEIFQALGAVSTAVQTYAVDHPRMREALEKASSALEAFFTGNRNTPHISYIVNGAVLEFCGIPLASSTPHTDRLVKGLKTHRLGGFQITRGITSEEILALIQEISLLSARPLPGAAPERVAPTRSPNGTKPKFHLATQAAVEELRRTLSSNAATDQAERSALPELSVFEGTARSLLKTYRAILSKPEEVLRSNQNLLKNTIDRVSAIVGPHRDKIMSGVTGGYFDDFTYHHSVNVCLITGLVASMVVKSQEALSKISLAALLHDVGKSRIPEEVLHKPGRLTPEETKLMEMHPTHGAEILLGISGLDPLCVAVAFGHHKIYGSRQYPETFLPYTNNWITRLISVVDIYEALTAARPYKRGMSSDAAFRVMVTIPGMAEDAALVRLLYAALGPFPVGSMIELSTGERAVVMAQNQSHPNLPQIRVLTDPTLQRLPIPFDLDLANVEACSVKGKPRTIQRGIVRQSASHSLLTDEIEPEPTECLGAPLQGNATFANREA